MTASAKQFVNDLITKLSEELIPRGFKFRARQQGWTRRAPHGSHFVHINLASHPGEVGVLMGVYVRLDEVEKLVKPDSADGATMGTFLENLAGLPPIPHRVASMEDASALSVKLTELMRGFGEPFLMRYESPAAVLELLLSDARLAIQCSPSDLCRAMTVCALLVQMGRGNEVREFCDGKLKSLRPRGDRDRLVAFINTIVT